MTPQQPSIVVYIEKVLIPASYSTNLGDKENDCHEPNDKSLLLIEGFFIFNSKDF